MVWVLISIAEDTPLQQISLKGIYLFDSISSSIALNDKLHNCVEGICFSTLQGNKKSALSLFMVTVAKREKMLHQWQESCRFEQPLKKLS